MHCASRSAGSRLPDVPPGLPDDPHAPITAAQPIAASAIETLLGGRPLRSLPLTGTDPL
jgi:hypothetical protein